MVRSVDYVNYADCKPEPFDNSSCNSKFTEVGNISLPSSTSVEKDDRSYGP